MGIIIPIFLGSMGRLDAAQLGHPVGPVAEGLAPPEELVIHRVKALDDSIALGLPLGDKDDLQAQIQA
jgi:hypothetical protein